MARREDILFPVRVFIQNALCAAESMEVRFLVTVGGFEDSSCSPGTISYAGLEYQSRQHRRRGAGLLKCYDWRFD